MEEKKYTTIQKVAVLSIAMLVYTTSLANSSLGAIANAFPDLNALTIKQISTIPPLMMIPFGLLAGFLVRFMKKKTVILIAIVLEFIGGIAPAIYNKDFSFILASRYVFGAGFGLIFPFLVSVIADLFKGDERRNMMGYKGSFSALSGIICSLLGGYLASIHWSYAFYGMFIIVPVFFLVLFKMPHPEDHTAEKAEVKAPHRIIPKLRTNGWLIVGFNLLFNIMMFTYTSNLAIVMAKDKITNPAGAGATLAVNTGIAFLTGIFFGKLVKPVFKKFTIVFALCMIGSSFITLIYGTQYIHFAIAACLYGIGFGTYNADIALTLMDRVPKEESSLVMSIYLCAQGLGQYLCPPVVALLTGALGFQGTRSPWMVAGPSLIIAAVILAGIKIYEIKKGAPLWG